MMAHRSFKFFVALALLDTGRTALPAQEPNCEEVAAMARVARAKTGAAVAAERRRAGDTYRARLVFASRELELNPVGKEAAVRLVGLIPKDQQQHVVWMTLGDSLCDGAALRNGVAGAASRPAAARPCGGRSAGARKAARLRGLCSDLGTGSG